MDTAEQGSFNLKHNGLVMRGTKKHTVTKKMPVRTYKDDDKNNDIAVSMKSTLSDQTKNGTQRNTKIIAEKKIIKI